MEKTKSRFGKLGVITIALLMIFVGFSASKYVEKKTGSSGNMQIAKWNVTVDDIAMSNTEYDGKTIKASRIAPGTEGYFNIVVKTNDTETGVKYTVSFPGGVTNRPTNLYFQIDGSDTKYKDMTQLATALSGTIDANATTKTVTKKVWWKWDYQTGTTDQEKATNNATDTSEGKTAKTMSFNINVDFEQVKPQ